MSALFNTVVITSFYATVVGVIVLLLKGLLKTKLNAQWHYLIWFILIIKLLVPYGPASSVSIFNALPRVPQQITAPVQLPQQSPAVPAPVMEERPGPTDPVIGYPAEQEQELLQTKRAPVNIAATVWFAGAALLLMWLVITQLVLNQRIRQSTVSHDRSIEQLAFVCKEKLRIRRHVPVIVQEAVGIPSLFGLFKPKILVTPDTLKLSCREQEYILLHELAHYKRKDNVLNYFLLGLQVVHWFNPVLWHCFKRMREDMEIATDAMVLKTLSREEHREYGQTLLTVLSGLGTSKLVPKLLGVVDDKNSIKRRIQMIKLAGYFHGKRVRVFAVGVICFILLGGVLLTNGRTAVTPPVSPGAAGLLYQHKSPYIGDHSNVVGLLDKLPLAEYRGMVSLETSAPPYGVTVQYQLSDKVELEPTLRRNATILFVLIKNVEQVTFVVESAPTTYTYDRTSLQAGFPRDLHDYAQDITAFTDFFSALNLRIYVTPSLYTLLLSSTPGIRIEVNKGSAAMVRYAADYGSLLTWGADGKVESKGTTVEMSGGQPVYWSPLSADGSIVQPERTVVEVSLINENGDVFVTSQLLILHIGDGNFSPQTSPTVFVAGNSLNEIVSRAIREQGKHYYAGEFFAEAHYILETESKDDNLIIYSINSFSWFDFENGVFTAVSGAAAVPTVMEFALDAHGDYQLLHYKEPLNGSDYAGSIRQKFPKYLWDKVLVVPPDIKAELIKQQETQAEDYLRSIGIKAPVSHKRP
jgi:beta-lactamase regulating signal transducer with metallopeptidase domain